MPLASTIKDDDRFIGLFVGRSGSGKSAAAFSFAELGMVKVFDMSGRVRGGLVDWVDRSKIDYTYFPPKAAKPLFIRLNEAFEPMMIMARSGQLGYKTIVFDDIGFCLNGLLLDGAALTASGAKNGLKPQNGIIANDPGDYKMAYLAIAQILAFLKSIPNINIIVTAHIVGKFGKAPGANDYDEKIQVGEQLAVPDKLAEIIPGEFDHVLKFFHRDERNQVKHFFSAHSDLARSTYKIPYGEIEITDKSFYTLLKTYMKVPSPAAV